jgi:hypothetical protein
MVGCNEWLLSFANLCQMNLYVKMAKKQFDSPKCMVLGIHLPLVDWHVQHLG